MCTSIRFTDTNGFLYCGRNLDWSSSYGEHVIITPRNFQRPWAFAQAESSPYAVIGMGIAEEGVPLYFDCANETGLVIAGLNFPGFAQYEGEAVEGRTNVAAYELPLWLASSFASVEDAADALKDVALVAKPVSNRYPVSFLHWMISDAQQSIVVEYTASGMRIHRNDVDVLANQPHFEWQLENLRNYLSLTPEFPQDVQWRGAQLAAYGSGSGMRGIPGDYYSPSRFVRAAYLNSHYPVQETEAANVSRLFHTLAGVSMIDGAARMQNGEFEKTIYTSGYSARTKTYYWSTYEEPAISSLCMSIFNLDSDRLIEA